MGAAAKGALTEKGLASYRNKRDSAPGQTTGSVNLGGMGLLQSSTDTPSFYEPFKDEQIARNNMRDTPDLTDMLIRNVERAERMRLKTGKTRASMFATAPEPVLPAAAPMKIAAPPPPTKKR